MNLKPCPFCGSNRIAYAEEYGEFYMCQNCKARGPLMDDKEDAWDYWNTRTCGTCKTTGEV